MKTAIAQSFINSISYSDYRNKVTELFEDGKVSGNEQSEDLLHYTKLNEARMNRLDKNIDVSETI